LEGVVFANNGKAGGLQTDRCARTAMESGEWEPRMKRKQYIANAVLWATAIIASAIAGAPRFFSTVLLPSLATSALLVTWPKAQPTCRLDDVEGA
jgi:hypothetical protein